MAQKTQFSIGLDSDDAAVILSRAESEDRPAASILRNLVREALATKTERRVESA